MPFSPSFVLVLFKTFGDIFKRRRENVDSEEGFLKPRKDCQKNVGYALFPVE